MPTGTEIERLLVRLVGDATSYQKMLKDAEAQSKRTGQVIETTSKKVERIAESLNKFGASMSKIGRRMSLAITAPLTIIGGLSVRAFAQFDNAMTQSTSIMKVTTAQIEEMRNAALSLSGTVAQAPKELAESYFFLASAGKNAAQAMALLPRVSEFATAGAFDMALATDLLTDAQSALGLATKNVAQDTLNLVRVGDVLVKANTLANASVQQFSIALTSKAGAALKSYNVDVEEGVAVLAALADQGIKAQLAGNALDRVIRLLSKASRDNTKEFQKLGFSVFKADGSMRNLADIIGNIEDITKTMSVEMKSATLEMLGFEARVQGVILPLLGTSDAIRTYEKELRNAKGITKEVSDKQMKSFANQMKVLRNQIATVGIEIGEKLSPMIKGLSRIIKAAIAMWKSFDSVTRTVIVSLGALLAIIGPLLIAMGSLISLTGFAIKGFVALTSNVLAMQIAVVGLKGAFVGLVGLGILAFYTKLKGKMSEVTTELEKQSEKIARMHQKRLMDIKELKGAEKRAASDREGRILQQEVMQARMALAAEKRRTDPEKQRGKGPRKFFGAAGGQIVNFLGLGAIPALEKELEQAERRFQEFGEGRGRVQEREQTNAQQRIAKLAQTRIHAAQQVMRAEENLEIRRQNFVIALRSLQASRLKSQKDKGFGGFPQPEKIPEQDVRIAEEFVKIAKVRVEITRRILEANNELARQPQKAITNEKRLAKAAEERRAAMEKERPRIEAMFLSWRQATAKWHLDFQVAMRERHKAFAQNQKDMEAGRRVAEQFMSPQLKFLNRLKDLQRSLDIGAFGVGAEAQGIFDRAVKAARGEFAAATKEEEKTRAPGIGRVTGARFGSLEAQQRIAEFKSLAGAGDKTGVGKTNELLTEIRDNLVDLPTPIEVKEAGLTV